MADRIIEDVYYLATTYAANDSTSVAAAEITLPVENNIRDFKIENTTMELIDCTTFTIDFADRKFIAIGLDPANDFNVTERIATSTRNVCISPDFLRRLYSLMGNILSIITDYPVKSRERLFLKDETNTLSKTSYRGKNMLVIDSHSRDGSRVLLSRKKPFKISRLETLHRGNDYA